MRGREENDDRTDKVENPPESSGAIASHPTVTCPSWLPERRSHQACTMLRHATGNSPVLSHTDEQTSIRFPPTMDLSPPLPFDDPQQHGYRLENPQPAPQQHPASGNPDLHAFPHALLQPRNWVCFSVTDAL